MSSSLELSPGHPPILDLSATVMERQITDAPCGHVLTNGNVWTMDGEWLVYDVRVTDNFDGTRIERVSVITGEVELLYESAHGAGCGVATVSQAEPKVVFLHGPEHPAPDWTYGMTRRRGMVIDLRLPRAVRPLDAMNYAPPFAAGALRGGSHLHMFSPDGARVSFTYEDEVLERLVAPGPDRDFNRRNIGVAGPGGPVRVAGTHPRNHHGDWFSVVVTRTVTQPEPGSDDVSRAFDESWIGRDGYVRADGTRQKRALAFQGLVTAVEGRQYPEIFVVDLPDTPMVAGEKGSPIEGTETRYPAPPPGVSQRRLTFTAGWRFPGVAREPRHWPRSSPDGSRIAFLMLDDASRPQLWSVGPGTGDLRPISRHPWGVTSAFSWNPNGTHLAHVMDNSVFLTEVATGRAARLTGRQNDAMAPLPQACVFSPDGRWLAYTRRTDAAGGFPQIFCIAVPPL